MTKWIKKLVSGCWYLVAGFLLLATSYQLLATSVYAVVDPLAVSNNRFGIHIISPTDDEASPAASLVNSNGGDWGYITFLIQSDDRNLNKWQAFFDILRRRHLIPIVRLATNAIGHNWQVPDEAEPDRWADFLSKLNWPIKNRYVIVYNEPNQGQEWGGQVNPKVYAQILDKTISSLKAKDLDFFVMNSGFDASAPDQLPKFASEVNFLIEMDQASPGIFNKLDGWVSHSYPNPGFVGSPNGVGQGTVRTWYWELQTLRGLGLTKNLSVFITETGWKHAEGINFDSSLPTAEQTADLYKQAFQSAWSSSRIVAITPFLLTYQTAPFDHFSLKKLTSESDTPFYDSYHQIQILTKTAGAPILVNLAEITEGEIYSSLVGGQEYRIKLTFKNTGSSIWNDPKPLELKAVRSDLGIITTNLEPDKKIEPGQSLQFEVYLNKLPYSGTLKTSLQLFHAGQEFESPPFEYISEIKSPVILIINSSLNWKTDSSGGYLLSVSSAIGQIKTAIDLNSVGQSRSIEAKNLLPDYEFDFTLNRPYYKPKTIHQKVISGENYLNFGKLDPDLIGNLLNPKELWKLLPWGK